MKALISPIESPIYYVSGFEGDPPEPVLMPIANSCRVAEVTENTFEVALPLFWADCQNNCVADEWYYNTETKEIFPIPTIE